MWDIVGLPIDVLYGVLTFQAEDWISGLAWVSLALLGVGWIVNVKASTGTWGTLATTVQGPDRGHCHYCCDSGHRNNGGIEKRKEDKITMKICPYCKKQISWWGGIDHAPCNKHALNHKAYIQKYVEEQILKGTFDITKVSGEFRDAEKYLTSSEVERAIAYGYDEAVTTMIEDAIDNKEMINLISKFSANLAVNSNRAVSEVMEWLDIYGTNNSIFQGYQLHKIKNGIDTDADPPPGLMLTKGERFLLSWPATCHALNIKTKFRGRSTGASYRLSRKFTIRHTEHRGKPISYAEWKKIGGGVLAVTNKHLYFLGSGSVRDMKERLSNVTSLDPTNDGFIVNLSLKTRPALRFEMSEKQAFFATNVLMLAQSV